VVTVIDVVRLAIAASLILTAAARPEPAFAQSLQTRFGSILMERELPARSAVPTIYEALDFQQATQTYLWALPLVAFAQWQREHREKFGAGSGDLVVYESYEDKLGLLTANATTPYLVSFVDLKETGLLIVEWPAGPTAGGIGDAWQRTSSDTGQTGPDKGQGGKYLIVPPGTPAPADVTEYYVVEPATMNVIVGLRVLDPDPTQAKALVRQLKLYPYAKRDSPPPTRLLSPGGRKWYGGQPRGLEYWVRLHSIVQDEPVAERDRFYMAMLASLGVERGKRFNPPAPRRKLLEEGARAGELLAKTNTFAKRFDGVYHWPDRKWEYALFIQDPSQRAQNHDQLWERSAWFYEAVTNSKGMVTKVPGIGQTYLGAYTDSDDSWLDGGKTYRLRVPAGPPAKQFWSLTVYDVDTRCFVDNRQRKADLSSRMDLVKNADGSVDLFFGPKAPAGKERNWIQTVPGRHWFSYFRLYAPTEAYFDRTWKLNDIELVGKR
jgi:hypothetical protein